MSLSAREKQSLTIMAFFIGLAGIIYYIVFPILDKKERLNASLAVQAENLREMASLQSEYRSLVTKADAAKKFFSKRDKGFTLFSFLDRLAREKGLKDHIDYMKEAPKTKRKDSPYKIKIVEMKIKDVNIKQLGPYLHGVETSPNLVYIRGLSISKTGKNRGVIDAVLQVETYHL